MAKRTSRSAAACFAALALATAGGLGALGLAAGCGSSTSAASAGASTPSFVGTYAVVDDDSDASAGSGSGSSVPFSSISFLDDTRYDYVDQACLDAIPDTGDDGAGDESGGTVGNACVREGTYVATASAITFTGDDGSTFSLPIANVQTDNPTSLTTQSEGALHPEALVTGGGNLIPQGAPVVAFKAGGKQLNKATNVGIVQAAAVGLGFNWVNVQMPYCQALPDVKDPTCGGICNRPANARNTLWDQFRSDCSGFITYSWSMSPVPNGGKTTSDLPGVSVGIPSKSLAPGDILLLPKTHVVMFEKWVDQDAGTAKILEEPRCMGHAQEQDRTIHVSGSTHASIDGHGGSWMTLRKK